MIAVLLYSLLTAGEGAAVQEPTPEQVKFFETSIRPVLVEHCQKCHGEKKQWAGLRLDSREALLAGGDGGAAVVPGKPDESLLIRAIRQVDDDLQMPPDSKLTDRQIADLSRWVEMGAPFPASETTEKKRTRDPNHWSFQPPADVAIPDVKNSAWPLTPIDNFVLAKLEEAGLSPANSADKRTWLRRVTFDLTGLAPAPAEIAAFVADERPEAFAEAVDRLLDSPAYGEKWGRHWLDIARYADSNGLDENVAYGNAWRYRDYVVTALNEDKPFDRFVLEQVAGDLLPFDSEPQRHQQLIATGFLGLGAKVIAEVDEAKMQMDIIDEQIDTLGKAFLGMTFGCARCHDHKFDPIDHADYYGLAGIFKSTRTMETFTKLARWYENPIPTPADVARLEEHKVLCANKKEALTAFIAQADEQVRQGMAADAKPPEKLETLYPEETKTQLKKLRDELTALEKAPPETPSAMGVTEGTVIDAPINLRGDPINLGAVVPRHVPAVMRGPAVPEFTDQSSGRLQLAQWLIDPQHPLTSRVIVNRVWRWHLGTGLVGSTDNFGLLGQRPTHPELLDWLARRFVADGWSLKKLHRLIVLSNTYRQSSLPQGESATVDPENRLYGRAPVRRLEAEEVRDTLLQVAGTLDASLGGPVLKVKNRDYLFDHTSKDLTDYTSYRRSLYLPVIRNNVFDMFQTFDFPDAAVPSSDRASTVVAPQALLMLNSDFVMQCAAEAATRLLKDVSTDDERLVRIYLLAYGREPTADELTADREFLGRIQKSVSGAELTPEQQQQDVWSLFCHTVMAANEFMYVK